MVIMDESKYGSSDNEERHSHLGELVKDLLTRPVLFKLLITEGVTVEVLSNDGKRILEVGENVMLDDRSRNLVENHVTVDIGRHTPETQLNR